MKNLGLLSRVGAQRDGFLALVDDEHGVTLCRECRERIHRRRAGGDHHDPTAVALEGRRDAGAHERRLAAPGGSDHDQHAVRRQPVQALVDLDVTPEEPVGVVDVERNEATVGALRAGHARHAVGDQVRILAEDRLLQGDQVRPGIDAQLGGQHRARLAQRAQRLTLTASLVLGEGEQGPAALAERLAGDERLCLGQHLPVLAALQTGVDAQLLGIEPGLLESRRLDLRRFPAVGVRKRRSAPQRQCLAEHEGGALSLAEGQQLTPLGNGLLETRHVEVVGEH